MRLSLIIESIYQTFSNYKLHSKVTGCYCDVCLDEEFNDYVHITPLAELPEGYLQFYLTAAGILEDEGNDFKYFLPRILEVLLRSDDQTSYFYTIVWKILKDASKYFSEGERQALIEFARSYYDKAKRLNNPEAVKYALLDLEEAGINI